MLDVAIRTRVGTADDAVKDDAVKDALLAGFPAARRLATYMTLAGHPGRLITFATSKTTWVAEFCLAGDDMYAFDVMTDAGKADAGRTQAFFATIQITAQRCRRVFRRSPERSHR